MAESELAPYPGGVVDPIAEYYDKLEWFQELAKTDPGNLRAAWCMMALFGLPKYYLDLGCGTGAMLRAMQHAGAVVRGVECSVWVHFGSVLPVTIHDLTEPLELERTHWDLVTCIEVAEHVRPEGTEVLLDNVVKYVSEWLVFTGAVPGQGGTGHINCRPREWWIAALTARGLSYEAGYTEKLRYMWECSVGGLLWLPQNVTVFHS